MRPLLAMALGAAVLASCGGDGTGAAVEDLCNTTALPLSGHPEGPTVTDVRLVFQGAYIVAYATATDPQGTADLMNVQQQVSVFVDERCTGESIMLRDYLAESGQEKSFGIAVVFNEDQSLYNELVFAVTWPVGLVFADAAGHTTVGRVRARVMR